MEKYFDKIGILFQGGYEDRFYTFITMAIIIMSICIVIIGIFADIKIRRINRDLQNQEELFHTLGSNVDDIYVIYNLNTHNFDYISPNFEKSTGIQRSILYKDHRKLLHYVPKNERQGIYDIMTSDIITETRQLEFEFNPMNSGNKLWLFLRIYPTFSANNARYVICVTDKTKEKEAQLLLSEALDNVRKANEAKKEFLSHMSHEIKTPINAIIGMTQIAQKSIGDKDKVIYCLNKIDYASDRLLELINNILDMSKIDSHKLMLINKPFCMIELLTEFEALMSNQAEIQNKNFSMSFINFQEYGVVGDSTRLYQILSNCVSNALKFTPSGGKIKLEISEISKNDDVVQLRFIISDTGIGMSEEFLEHIFDPFDQEESNLSRIYGGTGLGMSIVKTLVKLMGGNIKVESIKNCGTIITVDLQFNVNHNYNSTEPRKVTHVPTNYDCSGKRIMVVEDNEINREITCEFLKYLNVNVETAANGHEALELFEKSEQGYYDVILMDIKMPGLDGYETTDVIRKLSRPDAKTICIIAMTADNFAEESKSIASGMNFHITKPIDIDYFCSLLHIVMNYKI